MPVSLQSLVSGHRAMEVALDRLSASFAPGGIDIGALEAAQALCIRHYEQEEEFLSRLASRDAALAVKLRGQHAEALELAAHLMADPAAHDSPYLLRRFLAIVQHNIVEEERDVFPLRFDDPR